MSANTFRPHRKSRKGCLKCKERKVKCDEVRPKCGACWRREDECTWPSGFSNRSSASGVNGVDGSPGSSSSNSGSATTPVRTLGNLLVLQAVPPKQAPPPDSLHDLRLLWHYMRVIAPMDAPEPLYVEIRQNDMVEQAFQYSFLMEAILCSSALHLATQGDRTADWALVAEVKKSRALTGYMDALNAPSDDNVLATFCCSTLVMLTFLGSSSLEIAAPPPKDPDWIVNSTCTWFRLQHGIAAIMKTFTSDRLWKSRICLMMQRGRQSEPHDLPADVVETFAHLRQRLTESDQQQGGGGGGLYTTGLDHLERCMKLMSPDRERPDVDAEHVFGWPILCGESYIAKLDERAPPALALLVCYGAMLHRLRTLWFVNEWGRYIVHAACSFLDPSWAPVAAFAQRQVES